MFANQIGNPDESLNQMKTFWLPEGMLTLIGDSRKQNPKRGTVTERVFREKVQSAALNQFVCFYAIDFISEITLGGGLKKWHIFLFIAADFHSYWHIS